jgi:hypothetical protein
MAKPIGEKILNVNDIATRYLEALEQSSVDKVLSLFVSDGVVCSPLYGEKLAKDFYPELFADSGVSKLTMKGVMSGESANTGAQIFSIWFHFDWVLANGEPAPFDVVDVAEIESESMLIKKLHIIYDTYHIREKFNCSKSQ